MSIKNLPGSKSPYFWQLLQTLWNPTVSLDRWAEKYGDTLKFGGNKQPYVISFSNPEDIRDILTASSEDIGYVQKSEIVKALLGDSSLIFLPEQEHQKQRKLILPSFYKETLDKCGQKIIELTKVTLLNKASKQFIEVRSVMKEISLKAILYSIFGIEDSYEQSLIYKKVVEIFNLFESPQLPCYLLVSRLIPFLSKIEISVWRNFKKIQQELNFLIEAEITKHQKLKIDCEKNLLSLLVFSKDESGQSMTNQEICSAIMTLIFAGFETAAAAMSWMLYWVYSTKGIKQKLLKELSTYPKDIDPKTIANLPYLSAVCNETLRIIPPAFSTFSRTVKRKIRIGRYDLEPNTEIGISIYLAHRRKSVYPEPHLFKPERFLERQFSPYEYLPFGGGQCRCLGANLALYEMKIVLATILTNFDLKIIVPNSLKPKRHGIVVIPSKLNIQITDTNFK